MADLTNLTDRIAHLRHRAKKSEGTKTNSKLLPTTRRTPSSLRERRFANDSFMIFVYTLLAIALLSQIGLFLSLDIFAN